MSKSRIRCQEMAPRAAFQTGRWPVTKKTPRLSFFLRIVRDQDHVTITFFEAFPDGHLASMSNPLVFRRHSIGNLSLRDAEPGRCRTETTYRKRCPSWPDPESFLRGAVLSLELTSSL